MARRFSKFRFVAILVAGAIAGLTACEYYFPRPCEASAKLGDSGPEITVEIVPMHPYLAEYRRSLVLHRKGLPDQRIEMFPDTGGYSRTQLYRCPDGTLLVAGFFDAFNIDPVKHNIVRHNENAAHAGVYLGAFDRTKTHDWRFIDASRSPERELVAQGI